MDYLRDEVRSGFYIPTAIKQAWATQLKILAEIDRICQKHDICYFAEWGTLLGAVRHGGYVPWDDDLDIGMLRKDYNRFMEVALSELPKGFAIHNYKTKDNHWLFLSRVINSNHICFDKEHLDKYDNFPYIATIDIFVLDYRYADSNLEAERVKEIKYLLAVAEGVIFGGMRAEVIRQQLDEIENKYNVRFDRKQSSVALGRELYALAEKVMSCVREEEAKEIIQMFPWGLKGRKGLPKEYYESVVRLPFENTTIPVPKCYERVLATRYGNYMHVKKVWGGHDYPYFEGQKANLQKVADFALPEFAFEPDMLRGANQGCKTDGSLKNLSYECMAELKRMIEGIGNLLETGKADEAASMLVDVQNLAIDFGTLIENVKGAEEADTKQMIKELEEFCELAYTVHEDASHDKYVLSEIYTKFSDKLCACISIINKNVMDKDEILFVSNGPEYWGEFEKIYKSKRTEEHTDVVVVYAPMFRKDAYGTILSAGSKCEEDSKRSRYHYPDDAMVVAWENYDIALHCPKEVYIQNPYDDQNPCLTVPPAFYASSLRQYTDCLIYVPAFKVGEFGSDDKTDLYNMKHYVTAPGVICADKIFVQSANTKQRYVEVLTEFCGEDTSAHWETCVKVNPYEKDVSCDESAKETEKIIVYCIGLDAFTENKTGFIDWVAEKMEIFRQSLEGKDDTYVHVCMYPESDISWKHVDAKIAKKFDEVLEQYNTCAWCKRVSYNEVYEDTYIRRAAAYYGSPTPLAHKFSYMGKAVLISTGNEREI